MLNINVLVLTYNQEEEISRCLESILAQREYGLKEIVISDDCSTDKTWSIILDYSRKYPKIIRAYRNDYNLGIYPNTYKLISLRGTADLYYETAGDDALCEGWFKRVQEFILQKHVELARPTGIYCDWKDINARGEEHIYSQKVAQSGLSLFSLAIRGKISTRSLLVNDGVICKYGPLVGGQGLNLEEAAYDIMPHRIIEKAYYIPVVGSVYYSGLGISVELDKPLSTYHKEDNIKKWHYFLDNYIESEYDRNYAMYGIEISKFAIKPTVSSFLKSLFYYKKSRLCGQNYSINDYWISVVPLLGVIRRHLFKKFYANN